MNEALTTYFAGEKNAGLVLALIGALMLVAAIVFFPSRLELRSFAITLGVWSLLELGIGVGLFVKTGPQVEKLQAMEPAALVASERPRMEKVQRSFVVLEAVWVGLIIAAALAGWRFKEQLTLSGVALGFLLNASILLTFDIVAERRGAAYFARLS